MGFGTGISVSHFLSGGLVSIFSASSSKLKSYNAPCVRLAGREDDKNNLGACNFYSIEVGPWGLYRVLYFLYRLFCMMLPFHDT